MNLLAYFIPLVLAAALLGSPAIGLADDQMTGPINSDAGAVEDRTAEMMRDEPVQQANPAEPFLVAVDYCYLGSVVDDSTGEILDLYGLCDGGENFDIA